METLPESQVEPSNSRGTFRTVKPPDQCVISYNFQHANSMNFTHNLLIGMGFQETTKPHKNVQSSNHSPPNKQKLFSIISQPKKIFRNEAQSVNKAYSGSVMPKRYVPLGNAKGQRKEAMSSQYVAPTQQSHWNEKEYYQQDEYQELASLERKGSVGQENHMPDEALNSPYRYLQKNKEETSRLGRNQNKQKSIHESNKVVKRKENGAEREEDESFANGQDSIIHKNGNKNESVHRQNKKQSSSLQKNQESFASARQKQGEKEIKVRQQSNALNHSLASNSSQSMEAKENEENQHSIPINGASTAQKLVHLNDANPNNTSIHKKPTPVTHQAKSKTPAKANTKQQDTKDHDNSFQQQRIKSKKEIQDQQLDELQARVRREESDKFKKGYFKKGTNKEKQILPFQAGIEPFFANKNSFSSQTSLRNTTQYKSNDRKTKEKSGLNGQANHSISGANLSNKLISNPRADIQLRANSIDYSNKISRNDGLISNAFAQNKQIFNKDKENTASVMKKVPSNNLTAIVTSQRIKRGNEQKKTITRPEVRENRQPGKNERDHEDLTSNNQIKGFKVPEKILSAKANKASKVIDASVSANKRESAIDAKQVRPLTKESNNKLKSNSPNVDSKLTKQSLNNKSNNVQAKTSKSPKLTSQSQRYSEANNGNEEEKMNKNIRPKATVPRNANDKDIKFKKWRESELQEIQKERRDSKRRDNSKTSKDKKVTKRSDSQSRSKRNKEIDLDAEQEDKFGLFSKRKSANKPIVANKKLKKTKGKQLTGPQQIQQEDIAERAESENYEEKESNFSSDSQQQNAQQERQQMQTESMQRISSIHSSRITEKDEQASEKTIEKRQSMQTNRQNLQQLLIATEESRTPNQMQHLPVQIELQDPVELEDVQEEAEENTKEKLSEAWQQQQKSEAGIENEEVNKENEEISKQNVLIVDEPCLLNQEDNYVAEESPSSSLPEKQGENLDNAVIIPTSQHEQAIETNQENIFSPNVEAIDAEPEEPNANPGNKSEDFFEYNIKELSKFNETVNLTCNMTKYESFERDITLYTRAPIISFLYDNCQKTNEQINSFLPSSQKCELLNDPKINQQIDDQIVNRAIDILLSIDTWILQRIFEPFLNQNEQIGVWLYSQGFWKIYAVDRCDNFRAALRQALEQSLNGQTTQLQLQAVLRMISGVRVAKLKSTKKRVLSQLDYSLKKKHVLKALTSKNSKWGERLFEVVKVETSKQGGNVLQIKQKSQFYWVKEQKFTEIFQHFILICTRPSHFWTNKFVANKESHKSVLSFSSEVAAHGSVTLFYPSSQKSSLYLYKQLESKVLKFMGSLQQKANQNGNVYFQFRLHGTYFLFLETPAACEMAIQSTSKLSIGQPEYIFSQTLKNDKCEYVQIAHSRNQSSKGNRQVQTLQKLRQKFISMVSSK